MPTGSLGFRVLRFKVRGLGLRVEGLRFKLESLGFQVFGMFRD